MLIAFRFIQRRLLTVDRLHRLLVKREECVQRFQHNRFPNQCHGQDDDVPEEVEFLVDRPPPVEAQRRKRYETIAGNDECVELADDENCNFYGHRFCGFLIFRVVLECRHDL